MQSNATNYTNRVGREGKQKDPPSPHFAKTARRSNLNHVISRVSCFLPHTVFALQMLLPKISQARFCRQHEANNERALFARPVGHLV